MRHTDQSETPGIQVNQGSHCRIARENYFEINLTQSADAHPVRSELDQLDSEEVINERQFIRRFWVDAPPQARAQVIDLKHRYQLTDWQCRWLRLTGHLRINRQGAALSRSRMGPVIGWFYALALCFYCFVGLAVIGFSTAPAWMQTTGLIAVSTVCICCVWFVDKVFIAPERVLREIGL